MYHVTWQQAQSPEHYYLSRRLRFIVSPYDYRQIKLALTIRESTTIILGYGLGDMNVLSAIDWAENYSQTSNAAQVKAEARGNQQEIDDILTKIKVTGTDYFLEQTEETLQEIKTLVTHEKAKHLTVDLFEFIEVYGASYEEELVKAKTTKGAFSRYATSLELPSMII